MGGAWGRGYGSWSSTHDKVSADSLESICSESTTGGERSLATRTGRSVGTARVDSAPLL